MIARWRDWAARAAETLDDPHADAAVVIASLRDIARINRTFGGAAAALARLAEFWRGCPRGSRLTLLDVGTGSGDIPRAARAAARHDGVTLQLIGIERHPAAAREAARGGLAAVLADGGYLPLRARSVDLVLCAKLLHHLPGEAGRRLLGEMDRVARLGVVVAEIRRSAVAAAGIFAVSFPLRFHPATRRDAVISVLRGFTADELAARCRAAGVSPAVRRHAGWSLTAAWRPAPGPL